MATKFRKGDNVTYTLPRLGGVVMAVVRRAHRDGTCTVQAFHYLDAVTGKPKGGFLGYRYRYDNAILSPRGDA